MKKLLIILFAGIIVGLGLGYTQLSIQYLKTSPSSGVSMGSVEYVENRQFYRGWPLATKASDYNSDTKIPITSRHYTNLVILTVTTPIVFVGVWFLITKVIKNKRVIAFGALGLLIGSLTGVGQIWITSQRTLPASLSAPSYSSEGECFINSSLPQCKICKYGVKDGLCILPESKTLVRGWPLRHDTYESLSRYDVAPTLLCNFLILSGAGLFLGGIYAALTTPNRPSKKIKSKKT